MRMKKIIVCVLAFLMLVNSFPVYAFYQDQEDNSDIYEHQFSLLKWNKDEALFREWASKLLGEYLDNLKLDPSLLQSEYLFKKEKLDTYFIGYDSIETFSSGYYSPIYIKEIVETYQKEHESCDYHPYYELADLKFNFDTSRGGAANVNIFGDTTRLVDWSVASFLEDEDNIDLQTIYAWFLMNTIKQKSFANSVPYSAYLSKGKDELKMFDVGTGDFEDIDLLNYIGEFSDFQAKTDFVDSAVKMAEYAIDGYVVYLDILEDIKSGVLKDVDFGDIGMDGLSMGAGTFKEKIVGIWQKVLYDVIKTALHGVLDGFDDVMKTNNEEMQKALDNLSRRYVQDEFKRRLLDTNENVLKFAGEEFTAYSEYGDQEHINQFGNFFKEEFDQILIVLDNENTMNQIMNDPDVVELVVQLNSALHFKYEDLLSEEQLKSYYVMIVINHAIECGTEVIFGSLASGLLDTAKAWLGDLQKNKKIGRSVKKYEEILDGFLKDIKGEFKRRVKNAAERTLKEIKLSVPTDDLISQFWNEFKLNCEEELFSDTYDADDHQNYLKDAEDYRAYCLNALKSMILDMIFGLGPTMFDEYIIESDPDVKTEKDPAAVVIVAVIKAIGAGIRDYCLKRVTAEGDKVVLGSEYTRFENAIEPYNKGESAYVLVTVPYALSELAKLIQTYHDRQNIAKVLDPELFKDPGFEKTIIDGLKSGFKKIIEDGDLWALVFKKVTKIPDIKEEDKVKMPQNWISKFKEKGSAAAEKALSTVAVMFQVMGKYVGGLWDSAKGAGSAFWTAYYSIHDSLTNEDELSFEAAICLIAKQHSQKIENQIRKCAKKYRTIDNPDGFIYLRMYPTDIMDAGLTPNLDEIHLLTRLILMQNEFDAVGMGSYYSISAKYDPYYYKSDFGGILNDNLLEKNAAQKRYNSVVRFGMKYKFGVEAWDPNWDVMFTY